MNEPNEHERVIQLLREARLPAEEITPEHLEENLRWLVRLARPEVQAPASLRERVQALAAARRARRPYRLARFLAAAPAGRRRVLLGALPLTAAAVVLILLLTPRAPAQGLARTLRAMAQLQSAHCSGWYVSYRVNEGELRPTPARLPVEWWYRAPDCYREAVGPARSNEAVFPFLLVVRGD